MIKLNAEKKACCMVDAVRNTEEYNYFSKRWGDRFIYEGDKDYFEYSVDKKAAELAGELAMYDILDT